MAEPSDAWKEEFARLRSERDDAFRSLIKLQASMDKLTRMMASQNDRLDEVVSMLRRREAQLKKAEAEVRKLRRLLGLDDPDPEPTSEPVPNPVSDESLGEEASSTDTASS